MDFFDTNTDTEVEQTTVTSLVDELGVAETSDGQSLFTLDEFQDGDPAADFLAREQEELGVWSDELGFGDSERAEVPGEDFMPGEAEMQEEATQGEIRPESSPSPQLELNHPKPQQLEAEKIRQWRENYTRQLKEKDDKESSQMEELRNQAKRELSDWYKHFDEQLAKTKTSNREIEKEFVSKVNTVLPGTEWERVSKMCDFNPKSAKNSRDMSRMRSIMLQLKQNPPIKNLS